MCLSLLLTAQMLYSIASEHNADGRTISEVMELQQATHYMVAYRQCLKDRKNATSN